MLKRGLGVSIVVAHPWPAVQGRYAQVVQLFQRGRGLHGAAIVGVRYQWLLPIRQMLASTGFLNELTGKFTGFALIDLVTHDLVAIYVQHQVQIEPGAPGEVRAVRRCPATAAS